MQDFNISVEKTIFYEDTTVSTKALIIVPDKLPIKLTLNGIRTIVQVGEFAIIPPLCIYEVNSSPERYQISFNFDALNNEEFTVLKPVFAFPCVYHPVTTNSNKFSGYTSWILPDFLRNQVEEGTTQGAVMSGLLADVSSRINYIKKINAVPDYIMEFDGFSPMTLIKDILYRVSSGNELFIKSQSEAYLTTLYCVLGEEFIHQTLSSETFGYGDTSHISKLNDAIKFIDNHYTEQLTLDDISKAAGYNRSHMSRSFKEFYGLAFYDYLLFVRIKKASGLLLESEMPINELAELSGFSSSSTFNRVFKEYTGFSPRDFRKLI